MASRGAAYQCWLYGCMYASLSPRGSSASCQLVTAYVTANDRLFRTGPRLFVTQFKISTLLSSAAVGPASGKQQTRQTREHAV